MVSSPRRSPLQPAGEPKSPSESACFNNLRTTNLQARLASRRGGILIGPNAYYNHCGTAPASRGRPPCSLSLRRRSLAQTKTRAACRLPGANFRITFRHSNRCRNATRIKDAHSLLVVSCFVWPRVVVALPLQQGWPATVAVRSYSPAKICANGDVGPLEIDAADFAGLGCGDGSRWDQKGTRCGHLAQCRGCPATVSGKSSVIMPLGFPGKATEDKRSASQETCRQPWSRANTSAGVC